MNIFDRKPKKSFRKVIETLPRARFLLRSRMNEGAFAVTILGFCAVIAYVGFVYKPMNSDIEGVKEPALVATADQEGSVTADFILGGGIAEANALGLPEPQNKTRVQKPDARVEGGCTADRADIVDRNDRILASSVDQAQLELYMDVYTFASDAERIRLARQISRIVPTKKVDDIFRLLKRNNGYSFVASGLSPEQVQALRSDIDTKYSGMLQVTTRAGRVYPKGGLFTHVVGSVRADHCPVSGLEASLNAEITKGGRHVVRTSLDEDIQYIVMDELLKGLERTGAVSGAGIIMDVHTGRVVARVSVPSFDVNQKTYLSNHAPELFGRLDADIALEAHEFGSVHKLYNTALALERGENIYRFYDTTSPLRVGGYRIAEPHPDRYDLNMIGIFLRSNNRGSVLMALRAGHDAQVRFFEKLGLVAAGELDVPGKRGEAAVATRAFGYGVQTTMTQLAAATASLLNGGTRVVPVYGLDENGNTGERIYDEYNGLLLNRFLLTNVTHEKGTGHSAYRDGVLLGLKTGTSQIHVGNGYSQDTRTTVIGAFPLDEPRYSFVFSLVKPRYEDGEPMNAGTAVAPVAGEIAHRVAIAEGFLRTKEFAQQYETNHSLPYDHDPQRVAQN